MTTLKDVLKDGYEHVPVPDRFLSVVKARVKDCHDVFPDIYGIDMQKRRIIEFLAAGKPVVLVGNYGVAKTELSKDVLYVLSDYMKGQEVFYVSTCPVQEDPVNIAFALGLDGKTGKYPCPVCEESYVKTHAKPENVPVERLTCLREGVGYARLQSGADTHPEDLIGTFNISKLGTIGDPFDPRVFQPGKIGQASGGLLFVDEVGKLSEAAQYALIQAAEEGSFTPTKSRRTFPVDELVISTTNPEDEANIVGAVYDRLRSVKIPTVSREDEIRIAYKEIGRRSGVYMPQLFVEWAVDSVRKLRDKDSESFPLGPRVIMDAVGIAATSAKLDSRKIATYCDFKEGLHAAVLARTKFDDFGEAENTLRKDLPEIGEYLEKTFGFDSIRTDALKKTDLGADKGTKAQLIEIYKHAIKMGCPEKR